MKIDWWTLGLQAVNVLVLVWILARFLFRPITAIVAARQEQARQILAQAEASRTAAAAEHAKAQEEAGHLIQARAAALKAAAADGEAQATSLLAAARAEADRLRAAAQGDIANARADQMQAAADMAGSLAVDIARRLFARLPDEARITGFIDGLGQALASLPDASRSDFGANGSAVSLKAARDLTIGEMDACQTMLARVLGRKIELAVEIEPALIAGLEIATPHAVVRNSFRADLEQIARELQRHDHAAS